MIQNSIPHLTEKQSRRRVAELRRQGCKVEAVTLPSGDVAVLKKCPPLQANPMGGGTVVLAALAALGLGWLWWGREKKTACKVSSVVDLNKWAAMSGYGLMYFPIATTQKPPTLEELLANETWGASIKKIKDAYGEDKILLVMGENDPSFYLYKDGLPVLTPELKASYCKK